MHLVNARRKNRFLANGLNEKCRFGSGVRRMETDTSLGRTVDMELKTHKNFFPKSQHSFPRYWSARMRHTDPA